MLVASEFGISITLRGIGLVCGLGVRSWKRGPANASSECLSDFGIESPRVRWILQQGTSTSKRTADASTRPLNPEVLYERPSSKRNASNRKDSRRVHGSAFSLIRSMVGSGRVQAGGRRRVSSGDEKVLKP